MKNSELYHKTVDILVQAYFGDTLRHLDPCGCAVGNIVAANMGIEVTLNGEYWNNDISPAWDKVANLGEFFRYNYRGEAKKQIDSTGYTPRQIHLIEKAFENCQYSYNKDEWMFNGLMAVIEVLDQIHENTDTNLTQKTKKKFNKVLTP